MIIVRGCADCPLLHGNCCRAHCDDGDPAYPSHTTPPGWCPLRREPTVIRLHDDRPTCPKCRAPVPLIGGPSDYDHLCLDCGIGFWSAGDDYEAVDLFVVGRKT